MTAPLLILGWGNVSRGDDALGPMLLQTLRERLSADELGQIELLEDYQLQVEHALDLVGRQQVLLVDASLTCAAPFDISALTAAVDASFTTHALSPQVLLSVFEKLQGTLPPPCTLLAIRGLSFALGEPPSTAALMHLQEAARWAEQYVRDITQRLH